MERWERPVHKPKGVVVLHLLVGFGREGHVQQDFLRRPRAALRYCLRFNFDATKNGTPV